MSIFPEISAHLPSGVMKITPTAARRILSQSQNNPRGATSQSVIHNYAAAMENDDWQLTGQPIIFDRQGKLIDGFHRLSAVMMSGATIASWVVTGIQTESKVYIDSGHPRTLAQRLSIPNGVLIVLSKALDMVSSVRSTGKYNKQYAVESILGSSLADAANHLNIYDRGGQQKYIACAAFRLGVCLAYMDGATLDWIKNTWSLLNKRKYDDMSTTMRTLCRQIELANIPMPPGRRIEESADIAARAYKTFDPKNQNLTHIKITESDRELIIKKITVSIYALYELGEIKRAQNYKQYQKAESQHNNAW